MKRMLLMASIALASLGANAQSTLSLSTYRGTDLTNYAGKTLKVSVSRYVFNGWNTISLPFDMTSTQLEETFGTDCKLEKLVGVENDGQGVKLNFQDCKAEGIRANVPYILYFTGETGTKRFVLDAATIKDAPASISFTVQGSGESVTMAAAKTQRESQGLYGILAKDNAEATFANVDNTTNGFYATRCFVQLSNGNQTLLTTNHIGNDVTNIEAIAKSGDVVDVYNLSGVKVASRIAASEAQNLQSGIYVINCRKILIK